KNVYINIHEVKKPEKTAIIAGGEEFSYDWLARRVVATARYLNAQGIKKATGLCLVQSNQWISP
ncbi:MAG: hypothetical protein ACOC4R_02775, partial [Bacteroidota bacterium]